MVLKYSSVIAARIIRPDLRGVMAEDKVKKGKLSFKGINEQHGLEVDALDPKQRTRHRRMLDKIYERGLSDSLTAQKAAEEYCARVAGNR